MPQPPRQSRQSRQHRQNQTQSQRPSAAVASRAANRPGGGSDRGRRPPARRSWLGRAGGRSLLLVAGSGIVLLAVAAAVWLSVTSRPGTSSAVSAPSTTGGSPVAAGGNTTASTTQVALPDFGQVAADAAADQAPPELATPTPGVAGPTAVVVTSSPWQVLI